MSTNANKPKRLMTPNRVVAVLGLCIIAYVAYGGSQTSVYRLVLADDDCVRGESIERFVRHRIDSKYETTDGAAAGANLVVHSEHGSEAYVHFSLSSKSGACSIGVNGATAHLDFVAEVARQIESTLSSIEGGTNFSTERTSRFQRFLLFVRSEFG